MQVTDAQKILSYVEKLCGSDWLKDEVDIIRDTQIAGPNYDFTGADVSPLVYWWLKTYELVASYHISGQFTPSPPCLLLVQLANDLRSMEHDPGFKKYFTTYLKQPLLFAQAAYGIHIAAGYARMGVKTSLCEKPGFFQLYQTGVEVLCCMDAGQIPVSILGGEELFLYVSCAVSPGREPRQELTQQVQKWKSWLREVEAAGAVCTSTVLGKDGRGYFLAEESMVVENRCGLDLYLPCNKIR